MKRQALRQCVVNHSVKVCVHTHVESGSLSLLPRPGILKAFARLFFPPSGAKTVIYSSKPTRAADNRQFDVNKKHPPHKQNRHVGICILSLQILPPPQYWLWVLSYFHGYTNSWSCCFVFLLFLLYPRCHWQRARSHPWWVHSTWPVFACALLLCKFLDEVIDADVFHILLEFLVDLQQRWAQNDYLVLYKARNICKQGDVKTNFWRTDFVIGSGFSVNVPAPPGRGCPLWSGSNLWSAVSSAAGEPPQFPETSAQTNTHFIYLSEWVHPPLTFFLPN